MVDAIRPPERVLTPQVRNEAYTNPVTKKNTDKQTAFQGFEKVKQDQYNKIYSHELAHQLAGGSQAGGIVIENDANGIAVAGHVPIQMPTGVDKANPKDTYRQAEVAFKSATAPSDMSNQDKVVASRAQSMMSMASAENPCQKVDPANSGKNLNPDSKQQPDNHKKLNLIA